MRKNGEQEKKELTKMRKLALKSKETNDKREKNKIWKQRDHKTIVLVK